MNAPRLLDRIDAAEALAQLADKHINFADEEVNSVGWHHDDACGELPGEHPGPPEAAGTWSTACQLLAAYEFSDPARIRAVYRADSDLSGRDMLLEGRFLILRFYIGVRITEVIDEQRPCERVGRRCIHGDRAWGWAYETLEGHLERGRMSYQVIKHQDTGEVELAIRAFSQGTPSMGPFTRLGWTLFGRRTQLRFYRTCGERLNNAVQARHGMAHVVPTRQHHGGVVLAPSDARRRWFDRLSIRRHQPGSSVGATPTNPVRPTR